MKPRYYSISSSPKTKEMVAALTVGSYEAISSSGRKHIGVASSYLHGLEVGGRVNCVITRGNAKFALSKNALEPLIFVGAVTGVSPFIGFLEHRDYLHNMGESLGPCVLFFGFRNIEEDYIYQKQLEGYLDRGILTGLYLAESRPTNGREKHYVQDLIAKESKLIASLIAMGGKVMVCGDYDTIASSVRIAVCDACVVHNDSENTVVSTMIDSNKYVEDKW